MKENRITSGNPATAETPFRRGGNADLPRLRVLPYPATVNPDTVRWQHFPAPRLRLLVTQPADSRLSETTITQAPLGWQHFIVLHIRLGVNIYFYKIILLKVFNIKTYSHKNKRKY